MRAAARQTERGTYKNRAPAVELDSYTLPLQLTPPGTLTAHGRFRLVLLCSHPDTVHGFPLRKTQTSTPLIKGSCTSVRPRTRITPTRADCGYRTPLTSRLHGFISILFFSLFVNGGRGIRDPLYLPPAGPRDQAEYFWMDAMIRSRRSLSVRVITGTTPCGRAGASSKRRNSIV